MSQSLILFVVMMAVIAMMMGGAEACQTLLGRCSNHDDCCSMWCAHSWLGDYCSVRN